MRSRPPCRRCAPRFARRASRRRTRRLPGREKSLRYAPPHVAVRLVWDALAAACAGRHVWAAATLLTQVVCNPAARSLACLGRAALAGAATAGQRREQLRQGCDRVEREAREGERVAAERPHRCVAARSDSLPWQRQSWSPTARGALPLAHDAPPGSSRAELRPLGLRSLSRGTSLSPRRRPKSQFHCLGCSTEPPPKSPISLRVAIQVAALEEMLTTEHEEAEALRQMLDLRSQLKRARASRREAGGQLLALSTANGLAVAQHAEGAVLVAPRLSAPVFPERPAGC